MKSAIFWTLTFFLSIASPAYAQLTWDQQAVDLKPVPQETQGRAQFRFTNSGKTPVTVKAVKKSCGCTSANTELKMYQPGESGVVDVMINFGQRVGPQRWAITVETDDPENLIIPLEVTADLTPPIVIQPPFLLWVVGEPLAAQSFHVTAVREKPIHLADVQSNDPRFVPNLTLIKEGEEYQVTVTPEDLSSPANAIIQMTVYSPKSSPRVIQGFALVKPAQPPQPASVPTPSDS